MKANILILTDSAWLTALDSLLKSHVLTLEQYASCVRRL
jgi:hypothetical protein